MRPPSRRALLAGAVAIAPLAWLQGCGFRPLLDTGGDDSVAEELAAIRTGEIGTGQDRRIGHILRNALIDRFTAGIGPQPHRYDLAVDIRQSSSSLAVQTTGAVTRSNLTVEAVFTLYAAADRDQLYRASRRARGSYDVVESEYATLAARRQTAERAARELSHAIAHALALFFARRAGTP